MSLQPGFHRNVSKAEYLADPCDRPSLSASIASLLLSRSPAHAHAAHPMFGGHRSAPTEAMVEGTIIDSLLVGGDTELVESPHDEYRSKEAKAWRDAVLAEGKQPIKSKALREAQAAADAIRKNLKAAGLELNGEHQLTAVWDVHGVRCRARFDHWLEGTATIVDLKTTENARPEGLASKMVSFGYAVQWAAYINAVETLRPELAGRVKMVFAFAELEPPYAVTLASPAGTMRALGQFQWDTAVKQWGECLRTNVFPAYTPTEVEAPAWALSAMEASLAGGSVDAPF